MLISSWNVNSVRARIDNIKSYLVKYKPDILLMQEIKTEEVKLDKITKTKAPIDKREIKSSAPIEIVKVDGNSNSEKIKKKGWWST